MGTKKKNRRPSVASPWWKRTSAKLALIPVATILAIWGAGYTYKTTGATELRTQVYQPLFSDLVVVEHSIEALSAENPSLMKALAELKRTGGLELVPRGLRERILRIAEQSSKVDAAVQTVRELALREMSSRIVQLRTAESDRVWQQKAVQVLREMSKSQKGISDSLSFTMRHEGRSRGVDLRNPAAPVVSAPGGPAFVVRDWVSFPESVKIVEDLWTDVDYLYFNDRQDAWYYQITREDLARQKTALADLLTPVHKVLKESPDFKLLLEARSALRLDIAMAKAEVADRIRDPKQLTDLFRR